MRLALEQAKISFASGEVPVGCVIEINNEVIALGRNRCIEKNSPTQHAEINAIENACHKISNYRLINASIYCTLEPCHMCASAIIHARISNLYYGASEPKTGSIKSVDNFYDKSFHNHKVIFEGGYLEKESIELLQDFFRNKR